MSRGVASPLSHLPDASSTFESSTNLFNCREKILPKVGSQGFSRSEACQFCLNRNCLYQKPLLRQLCRRPSQSNNLTFEQSDKMMGVR